MSDVVDQTSRAVDHLMAALDDVIGLVLRDGPRAATASSVITAVVVVDGRLQTVVDRVRAQTHADGVMVVVIDGDTAHVVTMAGGDVVDIKILDDDDSAPAEDSYCKYSITMSVPFVVEDAMKEPLLVGNPYVELVRGYIGGALVVQMESVGALCAVTDNPRKWSVEDERIIREGAVEVSAILESALATYR